MSCVIQGQILQMHKVTNATGTSPHKSAQGSCSIPKARGIQDRRQNSHRRVPEPTVRDSKQSLQIHPKPYHPAPWQPLSIWQGELFHPSMSRADETCKCHSVHPGRDGHAGHGISCPFQISRLATLVTDPAPPWKAKQEFSTNQKQATRQGC